MENKPFIHVQNLSYSYVGEDDQPIPVLKDLSLDIREGEYVVILGHNGSGKSTFAKLLNLVIDDYTYAEGTIQVGGADVMSLDLTEEDVLNLRKNVGMVFQNPDNQLVATVVEEDVAFAPENLGVPTDEIRARVDRALEVVGMTEYARHAPHQLSGGQKQRVAIAGILAMGPECIIFDESTAMLDPRGREEIMETIRRLNREEKKTIVLITHFMEEAALADRVIVMHDGKVRLDGTPAEVFSHRDTLADMGLSLPQATDLIDTLARSGAYPELADQTALTEEEAAALLIPLLSH